VQNLEAKKLQNLTKEREKLEAEAQALEEAILELVSLAREFVCDALII